MFSAFMTTRFKNVRLPNPDRRRLLVLISCWEAMIVQVRHSAFPFRTMSFGISAYDGFLMSWPAHSGTIQAWFWPNSIPDHPNQPLPLTPTVRTFQSVCLPFFRRRRSDFRRAVGFRVGFRYGSPYGFQSPLATPVGQYSIVSNLAKSFRQYVQTKSPRKLPGIQGLFLDFSLIGIVSIPKPHPMPHRVQVHDSSRTHPHPVRVIGQVLQNRLRT